MLYGTTRDFLTQFGLGSIRDLPEMTDPQAANAVRPRQESEAQTTETADEQTEPAKDEQAMETTQS